MTDQEATASQDAALEVVPPDDAGAEAQSRFEFQVELAARICLQMLAGEDIDDVICEWHEDYVIGWTGYRRQLVSVKHLEDNQRRWTIAELCERGGLRHLYERWKTTDQRCTCLLQTNTGLRTGADEPGGLQEACRTRDVSLLDGWAERLEQRLDLSDDSDDVKRRNVREFF